MGIFRRETVRIALAQMRIVQGERDQNLQVAQEMIDRGAQQGARLICLPEAFATGINLPDLKKTAEIIPEGPTAQFLIQKARETGTYIVGGLLEREGKDIYDTSVLISPQGNLIGKYRRWFLWDKEKDFLSLGGPAPSIPTEIGRIGLISGYDINFPEACRHLFQEKVDMIVCIATIFEDISFSIPTLVRSRAFENHCYVLFCSGLGEHSFAEAHFMGRSMVACDSLFKIYELKEKIRPDFDVVAQADHREQLLTADLYLEDLIARKKKVPQYQDLEDALHPKERESAWVAG